MVREKGVLVKRAPFLRELSDNLLIHYVKLADILCRLLDSGGRNYGNIT